MTKTMNPTYVDFMIKNWTERLWMSTLEDSTSREEMLEKKEVVLGQNNSEEDNIKSFNNRVFSAYERVSIRLSRSKRMQDFLYDNDLIYAWKRSVFKDKYQRNFNQLANQLNTVVQQNGEDFAVEHFPGYVDDNDSKRALKTIDKMPINLAESDKVLVKKLIAKGMKNRSSINYSFD